MLIFGLMNTESLKKSNGLFLNHFLFDKPEKMNPETLIVINQKNQVGG